MRGDMDGAGFNRCGLSGHAHDLVATRIDGGEHKRLGDRINAMYLDKLDGRVDSTFFDKMSAQWREEQNRCLREIERHEAAARRLMRGAFEVRGHVFDEG